MSVSDVLVDLLNHSGNGRNVLEAMACGRPVLRKAVGHDDPLLKDGSNFLRYEGRDLADEILMLANNPRLGKRIGRRGRKFVRSRAAVELVGRAYEEIYEKLSTSN